ncbi:MAG: hypothetical protein WCV91_05450, partial [Candidatus Margulisiibacteriota bacterium]
MLKKIISKLSENKWFLISFFAIQLYLFIFAIIPFILNDRLQSWDTPGHLFAAWFIKSFAFPDFQAWNPFFYAGYPQGTLYPPLYHYLIVLFSFVFGLVGSVKFIVVTSLIVLPISFYYFVKKLGFNRNESALGMALMMLPIIGLNLHTGGTLNSLFFVGLGANSVALPILFFYLGNIFGTDHSKKRFIITTILLSLVILLHFVTGATAIVIAGFLIGINFNWEKFNFIAGVVVCAFCLCGFWLVPFVAYIKYYSGTFIASNLGGIVSFPIFVLIVIGAAIAIYEKDEKITRLLLPIILFLFLLVFIDYTEYNLPFHSYRFLIYPLILIMILPIKLIFNAIARDKKVFFMLSLFFLVSMYLYKSWPDEFSQRFPKINQVFKYSENNVNYGNLNVGKLDGRTIVYDGDKIPHIHDLRHLLAMA